MARRGLEELGGRKVRVPGWLWALGLALPTAAVLGWLYWGPISQTLGPTVIPILSPMIPRPEGAPSTARAEYDLEQGVLWRDCREAAGGHVAAEWWRTSGLHRAWVSAEGGCARPAGDATPRALRLSERSAPVLVLDRGTASSEGDRRRALCGAAHERGLEAHVRVAAAVAAQDSGADLKALLGGFARSAPGLLSARPGGEAGTSQLCNFRRDPPPEAGGGPSYLGVDVTYGQDRP